MVERRLRMVISSEIKIRGYHLDMYGHVNNARYLELLEEGRWDYIEQIPDFREKLEGFMFFVVNININYRRPALLGQTVVVQTRMGHVGNKSAVIHQEIFLKGFQTMVADADVTFVIADPSTQKALALEGALRAFMESLVRPVE
jgi:thioesterase-3